MRTILHNKNLTLPFIIASSFSTSYPSAQNSTAYSWSNYIKFDNGLIIQWGRFFPRASSGTLTFPIAFSGWNTYSLSLTGNDARNNSTDTSGYDYVDSITQRTANTARLTVADSGRSVDWFAIGI